MALRFVYPEAPALVLINESTVLARDIKWTVALWNLNLPDRNDPLPIPVSVFDWLRANEQSGAQNLFSSPQVAQLLKPGDHLMGSASVVCPQCSRGRTYIVSIVWGEGGWFSEVLNEQSGHVMTPINFLKVTRNEYFKEIEAAVPPQVRTPIGRN
jgi:hypothetical protein